MSFLRHTLGVVYHRGHLSVPLPMTVLQDLEVFLSLLLRLTLCLVFSQNIRGTCLLSYPGSGHCPPGMRPSCLRAAKEAFEIGLPPSAGTSGGWEAGTEQFPQSCFWPRCGAPRAPRAHGPVREARRLCSAAMGKMYAFSTPAGTRTEPLPWELMCIVTRAKDHLQVQMQRTGPTCQQASSVAWTNPRCSGTRISRESGRPVCSTTLRGPSAQKHL